jgi:hypothetical protein
MNVHYLLAGLALCGAGSPKDWGPEEKFVGLSNGSHTDVTCEGCKTSLAHLHQRAAWASVRKYESDSLDGQFN